MYIYNTERKGARRREGIKRGRQRKEGERRRGEKGRRI